MREDDIARAAVRIAVAGLPRRVWATFEAFTGRDQGARLLKSMAIWTDAATLDPAAFRPTMVGPIVPKEAAAALQAMGQSMRLALAAPGDAEAHAAVGEHLATALGAMRAHELRYDLALAQNQAVHAAVNGRVPDRPPLLFKGSDLSITTHPHGNDAAAAPPMTVPALAETLGILATRLAPAAFGEAAAVLLAPLTAAAVAALLLYLLLRLREKPVPEGLVPPVFPPELPGLVPPYLPVVRLGTEGFTATPPSERLGGTGTTPAPALPHQEEGPAQTPQLPIVSPKLNPEEKEKQEIKLKSLNLPTKGQFPFVPPKTWRAGQPMPRGPRKGYMDISGNEWVEPRGIKKRR